MAFPVDQPGDPSLALQARIERSGVLHKVIANAWASTDFDDEATPAARLCGMTLDHGRSVLILLLESPPSAIALMRSQYEALVRATWAHHAATDAELARVLAPLSPASQQAARKLPGVTAMLAALEKSGAAAAAALLGRARSRLWDALNSFVHGGIHPFQRGSTGYPIGLLDDVMMNCNGMSMLTLILLAEVTNDPGVRMLLKSLHREFEDSLPPLEPLQIPSGS